MGEGAVISAGVSRAAFGQDMHLAWGSTPLATVSVETKDSMEGGGQGYFGNTHQGPAGAYQEGQPQQGGPPSTRDWCTGWNNQRNPKNQEYDAAIP